MLRRLIRSAVVFAIVLVAYVAYAHLAVPWMEPPASVRQPRQISRSEFPGEPSVTKYQLLLASYFAKDHWTQLRPPVVIASSNEQAMIVLDEYERITPQSAARSATGTRDAVPVATQIQIDRFALLIFPTPVREGLTPPRDAIILEAPQGASLVFNDFRPERGQIGQLTAGHFPGRITIHSDMHEPGQADDLYLETANLEMNSRLLYTNSPVRFQLGENVGVGRELEIRFMADEPMTSHEDKFQIAGIDALEIRRDVRLRLALGMDGLLPGKSEPSQQERGSPGPKPPVELSCSGPFHFDFVRYIASFDRDVVVQQINANGPSDQVTANQLEIHFAPKPRPDTPAEPVILDPSQRQQRDLSRLEPVAIVAEGHPVVVTSPARQAEARGERIQIGLRERRLTINGGIDAMLAYGPNLLRAPQIVYEHPPANATTGIGYFQASGPGSLHYQTDPAKPQQVLEATWRSSVELRRANGQPVLVLDGRPEVALTEMGTMSADQIAVALRELEGNTASGTAGIGLSVLSDGPGKAKRQVVPEQLRAVGRVEIRSPQLTARTQEFLASFQMEAAPAPSSPPPPANSGTSDSLTPGNLLPSAGAAQQAFQLDCDRMDLAVRLQAGAATPSAIICDGKVVFRELPPGHSADQPLEISGGRLVIDQLETGNAHVTLTGEHSGGPATGKFAEITGRGMTVEADVVELDQRGNRLWSQGPGKATMLVTRDLDGRQSTTPMPLEISWQGGLAFDGRTVVFQRNVLVAATDDRVRCDYLAARLTTPIQFGRQVDQEAIDLAEIDCRGRVMLDHHSRDDVGIVSHESLALEQLTANQQTGEILGEGPGVLRSTRFGGGLASFSSPQKSAPSLNGVAPPPGVGGSKLHFLRIDFQRGLKGNLHLRWLTFDERVRVVYGPVDAWEQELDPNRSESLSPESIRLACDELRVNEDAVAARATGSTSPENRTFGPVQVEAKGSVRIDGRSAENKAFGAQGNRVSYEQVKELFQLEGDLLTPAIVWYPGQTGQPPAAKRISFVYSDGTLKNFKVDKIIFVEITPGDIESVRAARPDQFGAPR
jgi:hypothetical protein